MAHEQDDYRSIKIPPSVVFSRDVRALMRELAELSDFLAQSRIRSQPAKPKTSRMLDDLLSINKLEASEENVNLLKNYMAWLRTNGPILNFAFSVEPSALFSQRLITYLRESIDPKTVINVGLRPSIGVGCVIRTKNKFFDLSLRSNLSSLKIKLLGDMQEQEASGEVK
jgi:hypothetical protein